MTNEKEQQDVAQELWDTLADMGEEAGVLAPFSAPEPERKKHEGRFRTEACRFCGREVTQKKFFRPFKCAVCQAEDNYRRRNGQPELQVGELMPKPETAPAFFRPDRGLEVVRSPRAADLERRLSENLAAQQKTLRDIEEAERELVAAATMLDEARDLRDAYWNKRADLENDELTLREALRAIGIRKAG